MTKRFFLIGLVLFSTLQMKADEGMWLLSMLKGYTIEDMQAKGFKLTAEDIYSVNQACLKDAVVIFGGGCTGELISPDGLVITNHHCGYGAIQSHSSVEHDYLTDGFWAMSKEEELPNSRLSVRFLRYMEDVTDKVLDGSIDATSKDEKGKKIAANIAALQEEAAKEGKFEIRVAPMFYGNQYFLFAYERFDDVRLVGAPPSAIGNFGGDTDNWVWPRHTGDFSMFRIYADKNNEPASYDPANVPYKPARFLEISMDGVQEGDFTMVLGYPGSTQQFLYSSAIENLMYKSLPLKVHLRTERMEVMEKYMETSDVVRIQYASKYRGVTNAWKKWQGAIKGLERLDAVNRKLEFETAFSKWVDENDVRKSEYGDILSGFAEIYAQMDDYQVIRDLYQEAVSVLEQFRISPTLRRMVGEYESAENIRNRINGLYKDYYEPLDREMFVVMMRNYRQYAGEEFFPDFFQELESKYGNDLDKYADKLFEKSVFANREKAEEFVALYEKNPAKAAKKLEKDKLLAIYDNFSAIYGSVMPRISLFEGNLNDLYTRYVKAQLEMQPDVRHYPDANFTMRLTYGKVDGYEPEDGVEYTNSTILKGVMEKELIGMHDYVVPERLKQLYEAKDYGRYGVNGTMPVCFTASNHTSGGNSRSPVLNADGRLIGLNFDRNWHGTMSDEMYDPDMCRNITVDIRYVLFIIDKYAGAGYLLDEMVLIDE